MALGVVKSHNLRMNLTFEPLISARAPVYCKVGVQSYKEHYLHLWKDGNPSSFLEENLTLEVVEKGLGNPKQFFYLIHFQHSIVGILKLTLDALHEEGVPKKNVLLNKIYLLRAFSGRGIGKHCLHFVEQFSQEHHRKCVWLYTMKKGKATEFYQKHGYRTIGESEVSLPGILEGEKEMWVMSKDL